MSLTVAQLMELPCLRRAKVLAGHKGLNRIVTCLSVLEYSTPTELQKKLYASIEFWGSELVLTAFSSIADDVDAQCDNIRNMAAAGEVGMIFYYVGLIMPRIDPRLIQLADELDFVLICMPENEPNLRYSEVIHEVMDAIIRDELNNPTFALDLLEQMTKVPKGQQTVKTILRITSDRLRASTVITDAEYHILSAAPWPRNQSTPWDRLIDLAARHIGYGTHFYGIDDLTEYYHDVDAYDYLLEDESTAPLKQLIYKRVRMEYFKELFDALPRRDKDILGKYYGVFGCKREPTEDIAMYHFLTEEGVREARNKALEKLRKAYPASMMRYWSKINRALEYPDRLCEPSEYD